MAWMKVETSVSRNKKFVKAGPGPSWLWLCGVAYCQEGLTDGFIPREAIDFLGVRHAKRLAVHLVEAGLWDVAEGGWRVHDYLDHNKSADEVQSIRIERRKSGAIGGRASGQARRKDDLEAKTKQVAEANAKQPSKPATETATETATAVGRVASQPPARPSPLIQRRRKDAYLEYGRLYVPQRAHADLMMLGNHGKDEAVLDAWYAAVAEDYTYGANKDTPIPPDLIVFWKARYAEKWPASSAATRKNFGDWKPAEAS